MNFLLNNKKLVGLILIFTIVFSGFFVVISGTNAGESQEKPEDHIKKQSVRSGEFNWFTKALINFIGNLLVNIERALGTAITYAAGICQGILEWGNPGESDVVKEGWKIVRDLTNVFFVLVLLIIAFATILRIETYGMKALLPKLIIAALLINFSLVISYVFLDFAGVITNTFLETSGDDRFFTNIGALLQVQKIIATTAEKEYQWCCSGFDQCFGGGMSGHGKCIFYSRAIDPMCGKCVLRQKEPDIDFTEFGNVAWTVIVSLGFSIIFLLIALFVFGAFAILLIIRTVAIWILLILAPIAWLLWVLPKTRSTFESWWSSFLRWTFFAPIATFFIWLAVRAWSGLIESKFGNLGREVFTGMNEIIPKEAVEKMLIPQIMTPENLLQFIALCGLMIGGLYAGLKLGVTGARMAIGIGKSLGLGALGFATGYSATKRWWKAKPWQKKAEEIRKIKGEAKRKELEEAIRLKSIAKMPPIERRAEMAGIITKKAEAMNKTFRTKDLQTLARRKPTTRREGVAQAAAIQALASKPEGFEGFSPEEIRVMAKTLEMRGGSPSVIYNVRPDALEDINKQIKILKSLSPKKKAKLGAEVFAGPGAEERFKALSEDDIKEIGKEGSAELKENLRKIAGMIKLSAPAKGKPVPPQVDYVLKNPAYA